MKQTAAAPGIPPGAAVFMGKPTMPSAVPPPPPDSETSVLLHAARDGKVDAFSTLYQRCGPSLAATVALRIQHSFRGRLDLDEVLQEVWLRAWQGLDRYDPVAGSFRGWLFGVARFVLLEQYRALGRESAHRHDTALAQLSDPATSITRQLARHDLVEQLLVRAERLHPTDRLLLLHCGLEGWNCAEAAQRLDLPHEATRKRWQRLRKRLVDDLPGLRDVLEPDPPA